MEILDEIQDTAILYANILAQILKIDVTIVNSRFMRIAGTGRLIREINTDMSDEGHILKKAMESGKTQIVSEPGQDAICSDCQSRDHCRETFHMSTPIMDRGRAIGVICFTCFNQKQRSHALKNQTDGLWFRIRPGKDMKRSRSGSCRVIPPWRSKQWNS